MSLWAGVKSSPPLTICGDQNLQAKKKRSMTPRAAFWHCRLAQLDIIAVSEGVLGRIGRGGDSASTLPAHAPPRLCAPFVHLLCAQTAERGFYTLKMGGECEPLDITA